jgi:pyruvate,orthophosphate dikinase
VRNLTDSYKEIVGERAGRDFPQDPREQLDLGIRAVFVTFDPKTHCAADLALS